MENQELQQFLFNNAHQKILNERELITFWHSLRSNYNVNCVKRLSINSLNRIRSVLQQTRPQPGDPFGLQLSADFTGPRQQNNLNAKRYKVIRDSDNNSFFDYTKSKIDELQIVKYLNITKNEMMKSFVTYPITHTVIRFPTITETNTDDNIPQLIIDTLKPYMCACKIYEISSTEGAYIGFFFTETESISFYSVLYSNVATKYKCQLIFTSNRLLFLDSNEFKTNKLELFLSNAVNFLYCFITERYKPVVENLADEFTFYQAYLISLINACTHSSLRHSGIAKSALGPLVLATHESGIIHVTKEVKNGLPPKVYDIKGIIPAIVLNKPINFGTMYDKFEILSISDDDDDDDNK